MSATTIYARASRAALFSGAYANTRQCVEAAVNQGISLQNADLRHFDLSHASIDGADLRGADMSYANLFGANMSEADLTGATIRDADLAYACLAHSTLANIDFSGASFANTILTGAHIADCIFSCPTALTLPFAEAGTRGPNTYFHDDLSPLVFAAPPVVVTGLPKRIILLDDVAIIGARVMKRPKSVLSAVEDLCRAYA